MVDWHSLLGYNTAKIVTIRDVRLGLLHYGFMVIIVLYILIYTVLIEQRYLLTERPIGSIRLSLLRGQKPVPLVDMEYCLLQNRTTLNGNPIYPCLYQDELFVVFPVTEATAMMATTRYTYMQQTLNCDISSDPTCGFNTTSSSIYYVADIEHFTLLIDHTVYAPNVGIQRNAKSLPGSLTKSDGSKMVLPGPPNVVGKAGSVDILELRTLLMAAGFDSLDAPSLVNSTASLRYDGLVLMVFIDYSNTVTYNLNYITYSYRPTVITETEFKSVQPTLINSTYREVYNRHGIRMIFVQDGLLGRFDFQVTLLTFVAGLGLLTVSTVVVDMIAIYILPQKKLYQDYKYTRQAGGSGGCCGGNYDDEESIPINQKV